MRVAFCVSFVAVVSSACVADLGGPDDEACVGEGVVVGDVRDDVEFPGGVVDDDGADVVAPVVEEEEEPVVVDEDGAVVKAVSFPAGLACDAGATASVTVENTGSLTWTRDSHKLGAVDDSDVLRPGDPRVYLGDGETVAPGQQHTFTFTLTGHEAGHIRTDWQMVHEGVRWFGESAEAFVDVAACEEEVDVVSYPVPLPDATQVVRDIANERPDLLANSCVAAGGNNDFLHAVVDRLRSGGDHRWGYNWKRGQIGNMSQDVIDYYGGNGGPVEDGEDTYIVDIIGDHCGNPRPAFTDVTQATRDGGTIGRWTSLGRF